MPESNKAIENLIETEDSKTEKNLPKSCEKIAHQETKVTLPLTIEPFAITGKIRTKCHGAPTISISPCSECKDVCHYLVTQEICIEFPIKFGAVTEIKDIHVECGKLHINDSCLC